MLDLEEIETASKEYPPDLTLGDISSLLALARAGRLMRAAGANLRVCSAVRETGSCGPCEMLWDEAEDAWREADGG